MRQLYSVAWMLIVVVLFCPASGRSDTLWLQNGDRLVGKVQEDYFAIRAAYGQIVLRSDFLKSLCVTDVQVPDAQLQTVNNDLFSGRVLNRNIRIQLEDNSGKIFGMSEIKEILFDTKALRQPVITTIFTMSNNDRFSGRLQDERLEIRTAATMLAYPQQQLNRLEFSHTPTGEVSLLSTAGDLVRGRLLLERLRIAPDSIGELTVKPSDLKTIQFNSRKLLAREYRKLPAADRDGDADGVPDAADACDSTPWGEPVATNGCSKQPPPGKTPAVKTLPAATDTDGDGVADALDRCLATAPGTAVDANGCPVVADILFDFDSAQIKPRYYPVLQAMISVLKTNRALKIEISGHTDNVGPEKYNQALSEKRARMIKQYLVNRGIAARRITAAGFGSTRQIASNENAAGRALNRRVSVGWAK